MSGAGRFAPSPTGPLHLGSLVAAVGSWLYARSRGARWIVRMEDLDTPRVIAGSADEILRALERYALTWDGPVEWQSRRIECYETALAQLRDADLAYDCGCSRAELARAASAPAVSDPIDSSGPVYPGTCRQGLPPGRHARAVRFRVSEESIDFEDLVQGRVTERLPDTVGDFVIRRADGVFAYQLAVVVDDQLQRIDHIVRGGDLLGSTARQIALQRALGYSTPEYAHLPLVLGVDGSKIGKRDGALPLPLLDEATVGATMKLALSVIGITTALDTPPRMLETALEKFGATHIPRGPAVAETPQL